jgi:hypothetical protein
VTYPGSGGGWSPNQPPNQPQSNDPQQYPQGGYPQQPGQQAGWPATGPQPVPQPTQQFPGGYGEPQYGQPQYGTAQFPAQPYGQDAQFGGQYGYPAPPAPKKKRTGLIVTAIVAVLALAGGGVATVWALRSSDGPVGAASPTAAVTNLANALGGGDALGVLNSVAPAESAFFKDYTNSASDELKRLEILKKDADPTKSSGSKIKVEGLKIDEGAAEQVNDHLTITKLTEGKITIDQDLKQVPFTDKFVKLLESTQDGQDHKTTTIDIAQKVRENGGPIRIATIKVDGQWYPSLFYTFADYALKSSDESWPKESIPAQGAGSPEEATRNLVTAAMNEDLKSVIALTPPDEMGVLHDVGPVLVRQTGAGSPSGAKLLDLQTDQKSVTGGKQLTLKAVTVEVDGDKYQVTRSGDCYSVQTPDEQQSVCANDVPKLIEQQVGRSQLPQAVRDLIGHLATGLMKDGVGVVTTQVDGKWYVSPLRSYSELTLTVLRALQPGDLDGLLKLVK